MINLLIAECLRQALEPLELISRLAGLVKVLETERFSSDGKVRRFPIAVISNLDTCTQSGRSFPDLVPNQDERLMVYFEDGVSAPTDGGLGKRWNSRLRLVAWGNAEGFRPNSPGLVTTLTAVIQSHLKKATAAEGQMSSLSVSIVGVPPAGTNLFSQYSYSESHSQYLLYPYFSFGLDLSINFVLHDTCTVDLTGLPVGSDC